MASFSLVIAQEGRLVVRRVVDGGRRFDLNL